MRPDVMRLPESRCLECGARLDAIGTGDRSKEASLSPGEMALCVCIKCGAVMTLDDQRHLRGMTEKEMDELVQDTETMNHLATLVRGVHILRHLTS